MHSLGKEVVDLDLLNHPLPSRLGIRDEFILDAVFDFRLVPLLVVEHFFIALDPNGPEHDAPKKMPNYNLFAKPL
jgi:hypothetical protein